MVLTKKHILWFLILLIGFLATWKDFVLKEYLGEIFRSPIILLLPIFLLIEIRYSKEFRNLQGYGFKRINAFFRVFHILYLLMTLIYCVVWIIIEDRGMTMLGENIFVKSTKGLLYYTLCWLLYRSTYFILYKAKGYEINISNIFLVLTLLYILIIVVEYFTSPTAWMIFHSRPMQYSRIRLLTEESSWTGWVLLLLFTGTLVTRKEVPKKIAIFAIILFFILFTITSSSKQYMITIIVSIFLYYLFFTHSKRKFIYLPLIAVFGVLVYVYVLPIILLQMEGGTSNYQSLVTRSTAFLSAINSTIDHPLGTGGVGYFYLLDYLKDIPDIFFGMNTNELLNLGIDDMGGVSTQSTLGQMLLFLGIPGLFLFFSLCKTMIVCSTTIGKPISTILVLYLIIASLSVPILEGQLDAALCIVLITFNSDYKEKQL